MAVRLLTEDDYNLLDNFLRNFDNSLIYQSSQYLNFLKLQTGAIAHYLVSENNSQIDGCLPLFIKEGANGRVVNSLPFYGSNGAILAQSPEVRVQLLNAYKALIDDGCLSATIITSPFEKDLDFYSNQLPFQFKDERVGQLTPLPVSADNLMDVFHYKTRNIVRKGLKSGFTISWENGLEYVDFLFETHKENITAVGGLWKPKQSFLNLIQSFNYGSQYRIYVAKFNNEPVAALLLLYFNTTVEYFTPVTVATYRNLQPMSALIYVAMCDAIPQGYKWWNWGGTWLSQGGVYDFKSKWGTKDFPYFYYTTIRNVEIVKNMSKEQLLQEYPYFFVIPFSELN